MVSQHNINAEYESLNIDENQIQDVIDKIKNKEIKGINVTLPYKNRIPFLNKQNDANETHSKHYNARWQWFFNWW